MKVSKFVVLGVSIFILAAAKEACAYACTRVETELIQCVGTVAPELTIQFGFTSGTVQQGDPNRLCSSLGPFQGGYFSVGGNMQSDDGSLHVATPSIRFSSTQSTSGTRTSIDSSLTASGQEQGDGVFLALPQTAFTLNADLTASASVVVQFSPRPGSCSGAFTPRTYRFAGKFICKRTH